MDTHIDSRGKRFGRGLAVGLVIASLSLAMVTGAAAAEPTHQTIQFSRHIDPFVLCPAYSFHVVGDFNISRDTTTLYDEEGNAVAMIQVNKIVGSLTNSASGYSLSTKGLRVFHYDFTEGALFTTGVNLVTQLPGDGTAVGGAGRLVFSSPTGTVVEHDGPDTASEQAQLCQALA